tara:strand:- start:6144 stop:6779 length:636 start_codon:yes stop_codon:yes gene_type:complete
MAFLSQNRFPSLWKFFQFWIGGTVDKRELCTREYDGHSSTLEVGCSLGNISSAFLKYEGIEFTGIDIDPVVIDYANREFASQTNFTFICEDLEAPSTLSGEHGYVLFAGICHHVDDLHCTRLLQAARGFTKSDGILVVVDPLLPREDDPWFVRQFIRLEQGDYMRTGRELVSLLSHVEGFELKFSEEVLVGCSPFHVPSCARFGLYKLIPS